MEEPREQQYPVAGPQTPPAYPAQPPTYYAAWEPAPPPARPRVIRRTLRLLMRRMLYGMALLGRAMRPVAGFVVAIVALLVVVGWLGFQLWGPKAEGPAFQRADSLPPAEGIERFLQGQQNFDANLMWDAFSSGYQADQLKSGASKETLQAQVDNQRQLGLHFVHYDYVGGIKLDDGGGLYFYAVDVEASSQRAKLPIIFTADDNGKIVRISSPLNN